MQGWPGGGRIRDRVDSGFQRTFRWSSTLGDLSAGAWPSNGNSDCGARRGNPVDASIELRGVVSSACPTCPPNTGTVSPFGPSVRADSRHDYTVRHFWTVAGIARRRRWTRPPAAGPWARSGTTPSRALGRWCRVAPLVRLAQPPAHRRTTAGADAGADGHGQADHVSTPATHQVTQLGVGRDERRPTPAHLRRSPTGATRRRMQVPDDGRDRHVHQRRVHHQDEHHHRRSMANRRLPTSCSGPPAPGGVVTASPQIALTARWAPLHPSSSPSICLPTGAQERPLDLARSVVYPRGTRAS